MSRISKSLLMGLGLCMGCGGAMEVDPAEGADEVVRQELGESGCASTAYDSLINEGLDPGDVASTHTRTSANGLYDHSLACPKQYVVEVRQTLGRNLAFLGGWGDTSPATKAACELSRAELGVYGRQNSNWALLGTAKKKGAWELVNFFGNQYYECHFKDDPNFNNTIPYTLGNSPYDRVRISAKAYQVNLKTPTMYKAFAGVMSFY